MGRLAFAIAALTIGCSSSSESLTCCLSFNGAATSWTCPTEAATTQCCSGPTDASDCGADATPPNTCTGGSVPSC
jgi:hypothetical protein